MIADILDRVVQILDNGGNTQVTFQPGDWDALVALAKPVVEVQAQPVVAEEPAKVEETTKE